MRMNSRLIVGNINRDQEGTKSWSAAEVWSHKEGFQKSVQQEVHAPVSKPVPDERNAFAAAHQQ